MLKAKDLIQYGYFPSELPPSFHTITLGECASRIPLEQYEKWQQEWQKLNSKINRPESKCVNYSVPRYNRLSAVKNPVNIIYFVHRIIPEEIQPETIAV